MANDFILSGPSGTQLGGIFETERPVVIVHEGRRGVRGGPGDEGQPGPKGDSIRVMGAWEAGLTYCPGDAVTDRSSALSGVTSLYLQRAGVACAVSDVQPYQDPARWVEVADRDWNNSFGGIWQVYQINHGFTRIGQPIAYSPLAGRYVQATATSEDELGIAVVREVVSSDVVILQSTGEVPGIDPAVIYPDGSSWQVGRVYYVSTARGRLELEPPLGTSNFVNPILTPSGQDGSPDRMNGVALPWRPSKSNVEFVPVGQMKYFFIATAGQTQIEGVDERNNLLRYTPGDNTDVFVNGLNLTEEQYDGTNGTLITLDTPLAAGDTVEIWTPDRPLDILVRSTTLKLDNIDSLFDGIRVDFPLTYGDVPVVTQDGSSINVVLDATPQEPDIDYVLIDIDGEMGLSFKEAPERGTRFWGIALSPSGQAGVPPAGDTGAVLMKLSTADGDIGWVTLIDGGSW